MKSGEIDVRLENAGGSIVLSWHLEDWSFKQWWLTRTQAVQLVKDLTDVLAEEHIDTMPQAEFVALKAAINRKLDTSTG